MDTLHKYLAVIAPALTDPTTDVILHDMIHAVWIAIGLVIFRVISDKICIPLIQSWLQRIKSIAPDKARKDAIHIFDDFFISSTSGLLEVLAIYIVLTSNYGCTPWSTDPCLVGWPKHEHNLIQRWYFVAYFAYYLYEFICTFLRVGTILKTEMVVHHVVTMMLIFFAYATNLLRFGTMWMGMYDISNPLLHAAKVLHVMDMPSLETAKWLTFTTFALMFFVARVLATPFSVLWPTYTKAFGTLPYNYAVGFTILMVAIYLLQVFWFYKIVQMAKGGDDKKEKAKKE